MKPPGNLTEEQILRVKLKECGERLVNIETYCPDILIRKDLYTSGSKPLLRKTVADMLNKAKQFLPANITFLIRDAYRPLAVQKKIWKDFEIMFQKQHPQWNDERVQNEVRKYVADPNDTVAPGHSTGAAIDLAPFNKKTRRKLPVKTSKVSYKDQTKLESPLVPTYITRNRKIVFDAMTKAGFMNYAYEWWHYSYGEVFAVARQNGTDAIYGYIEDK